MFYKIAMLVLAIMSGLREEGGYRKGLETSKREQYIYSTYSSGALCFLYEFN